MIEFNSHDPPSIDIYTVDSRFFFAHYSLRFLSVQRKIESVLPSKILKVGGPRSVFESLVIGAKQCGWKVRVNPRNNRKPRIVINLSRIDAIEKLSVKLQKGQIQNLLLGPNIDLKSEVNNKLIARSKYDLTLVPSEWTKNVFETWDTSSHLRMAVWAAGVDIDFWSPKKKKTGRGILIYSKGKYEKQYVNWIKKHYAGNHRIKIMIYGSHSRSDYLQELGNASVLIWLGTTETQGIAICEAWAMGVPTIVLSRPVRKILGSNWASSAAPYLTNRCGRFFSTKYELTSYINDALSGKFLPRQWVIENQTAQVSFKNLLKIVEELRAKVI